MEQDLKGDVVIGGAKNAAVAILPATLLMKGIYTISNLPNISDVNIFCDILQDFGAKITWLSKHEIKIDTREIVLISYILIKQANLEHHII